MATWLGETPKDIRFQDPRAERFPDGCLNAKQFSGLMQLNDTKYGRVVGIRAGVHQQIVKLVGGLNIVEVHVIVGKAGWTTERPCVLWLDGRGKQIAAAIWVGEKHDDQTVESYWRKPEDLDRFNVEPHIERHKYGFWSLGMDGAVPLTRRWIKEQYTSEMFEQPPTIAS